MDGEHNASPALPVPMATSEGTAALPLLASTTERAVKDVAQPLSERLSRDELWVDGRVDVERLKGHFKMEGRLTCEDASEIILRAGELLRDEPNLLAIDGSVTVVGDIHGQFFDAVKIFEIGGTPGDTTYLFLGDYVDRGCFSSEVALLLFSLKINYPDNFFLIRGNHECRHLTAYFNFKEECKKKYTQLVYDDFMEAFDSLPLAAIINGKFLAVHGGLSPEIKTLDQITSIYRFTEPPLYGPMCDILWADPLGEADDDLQEEFVHNNVRGCSFFYGFAAVQQFLETNGLLSVIRAHEAQYEGYHMHRKCETTEFPSVITVFSAPNYCDTYCNKGAILRFQDNLLNIRQFNYSQHPYWLPNFMNVFQWSIPFVGEKVSEMLMAIANAGEDDEDDEDMEDPRDLLLSAERRKVIHGKVLAMSRMFLLFRRLREESDLVLRLKGLAEGKLPVGILRDGKEAMERMVQRLSLGGAKAKFVASEEVDVMNEARPLIDSTEMEMEASATKVRNLMRQDSRGHLFRSDSRGHLWRRDTKTNLFMRQDSHGNLVRRSSKEFLVRADSREKMVIDVQAS
eukprot:TRINITY_DN13174_c0_g1_i2.p1 TRINITY_DN13174_c0_g1~~TRINITY_DN13174_c0_g1_i2.p1  ORF type:complete len:599 (+),score=105.25 TRINITY_DN13174_c0_g1_i2:87-1799(+)